MAEHDLAAKCCSTTAAAAAAEKALAKVSTGVRDITRDDVPDGGAIAEAIERVGDGENARPSDPGASRLARDSRLGWPGCAAAT